MNMSDFMVFFLTLEMAFFRSCKNQLSGWKFPHFRMSFNEKKSTGLFWIQKLSLPGMVNHVNPMKVVHVDFETPTLFYT